MEGSRDFGSSGKWPKCYHASRQIKNFEIDFDPTDYMVCDSFWEPLFDDIVYRLNSSTVARKTCWIVLKSPFPLGWGVHQPLNETPFYPRLRTLIGLETLVVELNCAQVILRSRQGVTGKCAGYWENVQEDLVTELGVALGPSVAYNFGLRRCLRFHPRDFLLKNSG